jgi:hypothetical protein
MADPKDIKNSTNEAKNLNSTLENAKETFDELIFSARDFSNEVAKSAKDVFQNSVQASEQAKSFKTLASLSRDFASQIADISDGTKSISDLNKLLVKQEEAKKKFNIEYRQALSQAGISQEKIRSIIDDQVSIYDTLNDELDNLTEDQLTLLNYYEEQTQILIDQEKVLGQIEGRANNIEDAFGGVGKVAEGTESVLNKIGASKLTERLGISDAITKSRQFAANLTKGQEGPISMGTKIGNQFKVLGNLAGNIGGNLIKSLGPVPLILGGIVKLAQFFVESMFAASVQVAEFQRDMGLTAKDAEDLRQRTYDISQNASILADTQGKVLILQKQIVEAQKEANAALGTQIDFTQELGQKGQKLLVQTSILKDNFGLSSESIGEVTKESLRTGKSVENITKKTFGTIAAVGLEKKILLDVNKVLEEASSIQGNLRLSFKGSTTELAKGVAQAKLMGLTLKQNESIARNLLNFEDSIAAEMEAELLTGMNINLEKARQAALNGDLVAVGKEINNQGITYNKLQGMNLIQRDAIAKSLGLTTDELADTLKKQQEYNALQARALSTGVRINDIEKKSLKEIFEENKKIGRSEEEVIKALGEELYQRKQAEDAQTKFNKALDQAKESFARLAESGTIDKFVTILTKFISTWQSEGLWDALTADYGSEDKKATSTAVVNAVNKQEIERDEIVTSRMGGLDDFIMRPGQPTQRFNKDDIVIGGTNLLGGGNGEVVSLLKELITAVNSGGDVYLDGTKVGTAMSVSTYKVQ